MIPSFTKHRNSHSAYQQAVLADAPQFYYPCNELTGATLLDLSGSSLNGTCAGGYTRNNAAIAPGLSGSVLFDGSTGYFQKIASQSSPTGNLTLELWFKTSAQGYLLGFENPVSTSPSYYDRRMYIGTDNKIHAGTYNGGQQLVTSANTVTDGLAHHVVLVFSSAGAQLFVDGTSQGTNASATITNSYTGYFVGAGETRNDWTLSPTNIFLAGAISDVAVYLSALSSTRISSHYTAGTA